MCTILFFYLTRVLFYCFIIGASRISLFFSHALFFFKDCRVHVLLIE